MYKILSLGIFIFFIWYTSDCQWIEEQHNGYFNKPIIKNNDTATLIGRFGECYISFNQGNNWHNRSIDYDKNIRNAQILNDSILCLAVHDTIDNFYISHNLGIDWEIQTPIKQYITDLQFFSDTLGFLAADRYILKYNAKTQKVDTIWTFSPIDSVKSGFVNSILFVNENVVYANGGMLRRNSEGFVRNFSFVMKSVDYGYTWNYILISDSIKIHNSFLYHLGNLIYTHFGLNIVLIDSLDKLEIRSIPNSIGNLPSLSKNVITSVALITKEIGFVTISPTVLLFPPQGSGYDLILKTENGGDTWKRQYIDTFQLSLQSYYPTLSGIAFFNDSAGLSCGYNKILKTSNQGGLPITNIRYLKSERFNIFISNNALVIQPFNEYKSLTVIIYDIEGRNILQKKRNYITKDSTYEIDLNFAKKGIYIVQIISENTVLKSSKIYIR